MSNGDYRCGPGAFNVPFANLPFNLFNLNLSTLIELPYIEEIPQNTLDNEEDRMQEDMRLGQICWCLCSSCLPMLNQRESVCYKGLHFLSEAFHDKNWHQRILICTKIVCCIM